MTIYIDENYEVYTEKTIDKEIAKRFSDCNYDGVVEYIADNYSEAEIFTMLPSNIQAEILEDAKRWILDNEFCIQYIDEPLPCDRCPFAK